MLTPFWRRNRHGVLVSRARLEERTRIACELHDSLLQALQGLIFRLQAVRLLLPERPCEAAKVLDGALEAADQAIGAGRDAVQNLLSGS